MTRHIYLVAATVACIAATPARTADQVSISANGWTITADAGQGRLTIARDGLGILMRDVRLGLRGARAFREWTNDKKEGKRLSIKTDQPRTGWAFELAPDALIVSSTSNDGVVAADVPAPRDRIVARTMDQQGVPVDWIGTEEVAEGYGGEVTRNRSYLPRQNPDVLYFALGQVSASTLHSLFDRKTDTAINFTSDTTLTRSTNDPDLLARELRRGCECARGLSIGHAEGRLPGSSEPVKWVIEFATR